MPHGSVLRPTWPQATWWASIATRRPSRGCSANSESSTATVSSRAGTKVSLETGIVEADGSDRYTIGPGRSSPELEGRRAITIANSGVESGPELRYLDDSAAAHARLLEGGVIDAIADDTIATQWVAQQSRGSLTVVGLGSDLSRGGFVLAAGDSRLNCLNERIRWLTDDGELEFTAWLADPQIFALRADHWNRER